MSTISERVFQNAEVPFEIRKVFANAGEPPEEFRGQVMLWRECVARAVMDALGYTGQSEPDRHNAILLEAQKWFYEDEDVEEVFENAGMSLGAMRECVIKHFAEQKPMVSKKSLTKKKTSATSKPQSKRKSNVKASKANGPKRNRSRKRIPRPRAKT